MHMMLARAGCPWSWLLLSNDNFIAKPVQPQSRTFLITQPLLCSLGWHALQALCMTSHRLMVATAAAKQHLSQISNQANSSIHCMAQTLAVNTQNTQTLLLLHSTQGMP